MFCSYVLLDFDSGIILTSKVSWPFSKQTQVNEESAYYLETRGVFYIFFFKTRVNITVLVSQGCCNKLSQSSSLNTIEISSFRVLEIRSLKLRYHQGHAPSVKELFLASLPCCLWVLAFFDIFWILAASFQFLPFSLQGHLPTVSVPLCVPLVSYRDTSHIGFKANPNPISSHLK